MINLDKFEYDVLYDADIRVLYDKIVNKSEYKVIFAGRLCTILEFNTTLNNCGGYIEFILKSTTGEYKQKYNVIVDD
jgi:hypothetical protein